MQQANKCQSEINVSHPRTTALVAPAQNLVVSTKQLLRSHTIFVWNSCAVLTNQNVSRKSPRVFSLERLSLKLSDFGSCAVQVFSAPFISARSLGYAPLLRLNIIWMRSSYSPASSALKLFRFEATSILCVRFACKLPFKKIIWEKRQLGSEQNLIFT